jgi:dTMP kinase
MAYIVAFEGIDGSGKETQSNLLQQRCVASGLRTALIRFPQYGQTAFAELITDYLNGRLGSLGEVDPRLAGLLFAGDRFECKKEINEAVGSTDVVIFDRYVASNLAH